ncbi:hypothetical protein quinque_002321 [Culex quinquefasciatus]
MVKSRSALPPRSPRRAARSPGSLRTPQTVGQELPQTVNRAARLPSATFPRQSATDFLDPGRYFRPEVFPRSFPFTWSCGQPDTHRPVKSLPEDGQSPLPPRSPRRAARSPGSLRTPQTVGQELPQTVSRAARLPSATFPRQSATDFLDPGRYFRPEVFPRSFPFTWSCGQPDTHRPVKSLPEDGQSPLPPRSPRRAARSPGSLRTPQTVGQELPQTVSRAARLPSATFPRQSATDFLDPGRYFRPEVFPRSFPFTWSCGQPDPHRPVKSLPEDGQPRYVSLSRKLRPRTAGK